MKAVWFIIIVLVCIGSYVMGGIRVDYTPPEPTLDTITKIDKAISLTILDEINVERAWLQSFKDATATAVSLADFKTKVAALSDMPARTTEQLKTAVTAKYRNLP